MSASGTGPHSTRQPFTRHGNRARFPFRRSHPGLRESALFDDKPPARVVQRRRTVQAQPDCGPGSAAWCSATSWLPGSRSLRTMLSWSESPAAPALGRPPTGRHMVRARSPGRRLVARQPCEVSSVISAAEHAASSGGHVAAPSPAERPRRSVWPPACASQRPSPRESWSSRTWFPSTRERWPSRPPPPLNSIGSPG